MKILILEPYFTGSHAAWAEGYARHSRHDVEILSLEGQFWKWRMHGGAMALARKFLERDKDPDLLFASDMLDLTTFLALTRERTADVPCAVYFHENQLTYPWSPDDRDVRAQRDIHYAFINYASALAADAIIFNSSFHRRSFLEELPRMLNHFPDHKGLDTVAEITEKSQVLPLGIDCERLDGQAPEEVETESPPVILWNHRWEYDKNPGDFFAALIDLSCRDIDFRVAVLGENFRQVPEEFERGRKQLGDRILHFGYVEDYSEYVRWLRRADILPVTSHHDFFGMSVVEAVYCGCYPLLPRRLSYPEIFPERQFREHYYADPDELREKLAWVLENSRAVRGRDFRSHLMRYSWQRLTPCYDEVLAALRRYPSGID